jgi:hypothetical protein
MLDALCKYENFNVREDTCLLQAVALLRAFRDNTGGFSTQLKELLGNTNETRQSCKEISMRIDARWQLGNFIEEAAQPAKTLEQHQRGYKGSVGLANLGDCGEGYIAKGTGNRAFHAIAFVLPTSQSEAFTMELSYNDGKDMELRVVVWKEEQPTPINPDDFYAGLEEVTSDMQADGETEVGGDSIEEDVVEVRETSEFAEIEYNGDEHQHADAEDATGSCLHSAVPVSQLGLDSDNSSDEDEDYDECEDGDGAILSSGQNHEVQVISRKDLQRLMKENFPGNGEGDALPLQGTSALSWSTRVEEWCRLDIIMSSSRGTDWPKCAGWLPLESRTLLSRWRVT